ncbi:hypothetical protein [Pseudanabaena sp. ABRG5-3]|uniref:hypothetical protein n=1 Tax=Pseudanabaena sp. ABRG5-3 TaxID=685565 RepID=UPI000DC6F75C|nr:hypothetical protein [Pseudanabaena sp. ABRG5-3]BBC27228.1 hypothetical protein ABRG53_g002 [Pseudanabaena sp. ABRG5-3]
MNREEAFELAKLRGCTVDLPKSFADMWTRAEKQGKEYESFGLSRTKQGKEYIYFDTLIDS